MALPTTHAIVRGVGKFRSKRVLGLAGAFVLVYAVWTASLNTVIVRLRATDGMGIAYGVTLPLSGPEATGVLATATVVGAALLVLLVRAFARDVNVLGKRTSPLRTLTAVTRGVVVLVLGGVATVLGFALLLFPGVVVLVHLPLALVAVATDGAGVGRAVGVARTRADGHRLRLAGIVLSFALLSVAIGVAGAATSFVSPPVEFALGVVLTGAITVAAAAVSTEYVRGLDKPSPSDRRADSRAL